MMEYKTEKAVSRKKTTGTFLDRNWTLCVIIATVIVMAVGVITAIKQREKAAENEVPVRVGEALSIRILSRSAMIETEHASVGIYHEGGLLDLEGKQIYLTGLSSDKLVPKACAGTGKAATCYKISAASMKAK